MNKLTEKTLADLCAEVQTISMSVGRFILEQRKNFQQSMPCQVG
jgi:hypothetical protein